MSADENSEHQERTVSTSPAYGTKRISGSGLPVLAGSLRRSNRIDQSMENADRDGPVQYASEHRRPRTGNPFRTVCRVRRDGTFLMFRVPIGRHSDSFDGLKVLHHFEVTRRRSVLSAHTAILKWPKSGRI